MYRPFADFGLKTQATLPLVIYYRRPKLLPQTAASR